MKQYYVPKAEYKRWKKDLSEKGILFLYGKVGSGKTTQASYFAEKNYGHHLYLSTKEENFLAEAEKFLHKKEKAGCLLLLDDIHLLKDTKQQKRLFELLIAHIHKESFIPIILLSRGSFPSYLSALKMTNMLEVVSADTLALPEEFIENQMGEDSKNWEVHSRELEEALEIALDFSQGNPVAYRTFYQHWRENPNQGKLAKEKSQKDFLHYLDHFVFSTWEEREQEMAMKLAAFPKLTEDGISYVFQCNPTELVDSLNQNYYFIQHETETNYSINPIFQSFLLHKFSTCGEIRQKKVYCQIGAFYEKERELEFALLVYHKAKYWEKIIEILIVMSENAAGCHFARVADQYMDDIPEEYDVGNPALLGAKIMLFSYKMQSEEFDVHLEKLRFLAHNETNLVIQKEAQYIYMRTLIASPLVSGQKLMANLKEINSFTSQNKEVLRNIMPTGNYPSLVSGGIDLTDLIPVHTLAYPFLKRMMETRLGIEGFGVSDGSMGEMYYEQNKLSKAMTYLTKALSEANLKGSLRVQYAVTVIMAKLMIAEGQSDASKTTIENMYQKATKQSFYELLPNISASLVLVDLLKQEQSNIDFWMEKSAPDEHETFYITDRFQLFAKSKVYVSQHRYMEALFILDLLEHYGRKFKRSYFLTETLILRSIVLYRLGEPWETHLFEAVSFLGQYHCVRVFADFGKALLPLWQEVNWESIGKKKFIEAVETELEQMAKYYPLFLPEKKETATLTPKEIEVLTLVAEGQNNSQIAENICASVSTVKYHLSNINQKLEAENRIAAVKEAKERRLI